ncbi:MAG: cyclophilin-like fold protein [Acutalibacteraceae bacterium]|jgi:rhodanese-related sulfurtransferase
MAQGSILKYVLIALVGVAVIAVAAVALIIFFSKRDVTDGPEMAGHSYTPISQEEARRMMALDDGHIVVDVRRQDEYDAGHIPGAICVPNEIIGARQPEALPDFDQIILVYCRSGRRSKEAAQKLFALGYTRVYEFGGIIDWTGETVMNDKTENAAIQPTPVLVIEANGNRFYATLENNSSAGALIDKLNAGALTVDLHDYGHFEKVGALPWELPRNDERITTAPGDVILYQGDQITVYYDENTWDFTRLAHIGNATREQLLDALGDGDVRATFSLEWSE